MGYLAQDETALMSGPRGSDSSEQLPKRPGRHSHRQANHRPKHRRSDGHPGLHSADSSPGTKASRLLRSEAVKGETWTEVILTLSRKAYRHPPSLKMSPPLVPRWVTIPSF